MSYHKGSQPPEGSTAAWLEWAEVQTSAGLKQTQCPGCKLWLFPQEFKTHKCK